MIEQAYDTLSRLYHSNAYIRFLLRSLGFRARDEYYISSRAIEYPWVYKNLGISEGTILDVGSGLSELPFILGSFGFTVIALDLHKCKNLYYKDAKNVQFIVGDITRSPFNGQSFEVVTAVSTLEHIGLGRYDDMIDLSADKVAAHEIFRILKKKGRLLMTVPYGNPSISILHRVYDEESLYELLRPFTVEFADFFLKDKTFWKGVSQKELKDVNSSPNIRGIACVCATKIS